MPLLTPGAAPSVSLTIGSSTTASTGTAMNHAIWRVWSDVCAKKMSAGTSYTDRCIPSATTSTVSLWSTWCDRDAEREAVIYEARRTWTEWNAYYADERWPGVLVRRATAFDVRHAVEIDAAARRAEDLLRQNLTDEQREDLEKKNCFYLESLGKDGKRRRYRIDRGTHGNVKLLDDKGSIVGTYCVQPDNVPAADAMLAQKLWLETDEEAFRKVANFTRRRP